VAVLTHPTVKTKDIKRYCRRAAALFFTRTIVLREALPIVLSDLKSLKASLEARIESNKPRRKLRLMNLMRNEDNLDRVEDLLVWIGDVSDLLQ
jgi:hypothetical protein